jgi:hypothetical protein
VTGRESTGGQGTYNFGLHLTLSTDNIAGNPNSSHIRPLKSNDNDHSRSSPLHSVASEYPYWTVTPHPPSQIRLASISPSLSSASSAMCDIACPIIHLPRRHNTLHALHTTPPSHLGNLSLFQLIVNTSYKLFKILGSAAACPLSSHRLKCCVVIEPLQDCIWHHSVSST